MSSEFVKEDLGEARSFLRSEEGTVRVSYSLSCSCRFLFFFCILNHYCLTCVKKNCRERNKANKYEQIHKHTDRTKSNATLAEEKLCIM